MRKGIKPQAAMIVSHARVAHAAERYVLVGNVHDGVVDARASGRCGTDYLLSGAHLAKIV